MSVAERIATLICSSSAFERARERTHVVGGALARETAEHDEIGERIAAETVRAVHAGAALARSKQAGNARHLRVGFHADAAHEVVERRPDFHRLLGDVDLGELLELVIHAGEASLDEVRRTARSDVEERAAMR